MWDQPWRFPMRTLKYDCLGVQNVVSVWSYQSLRSGASKDCMFANDLSQETKGKERWGPFYNIWWSIFGGFLFVDRIIFDDNVLDYILGSWRLLRYNRTHHQKGTIACGQRDSSFMLAPKGVDINIYYVCVLGGSFCMFSWHHEAMDAVTRLIVPTPAAFPIYKHRMCVPLTWNYDIKVSGDHINWLTLSQCPFDICWPCKVLSGWCWVSIAAHLQALQWPYYFLDILALNGCAIFKFIWWNGVLNARVVLTIFGQTLEKEAHILGRWKLIYGACFHYWILEYTFSDQVHKVLLQYGHDVASEILFLEWYYNHIVRALK